MIPLAPPDLARPAPATNGELVSRVQQLRLDNQLGAAKSGGGGAAWLPWVLCLLLAGAWALFAVRGYRNPAPSAVAEAVPAANAPRADGNATSPTLPDTPALAAGSIQLEVKGYLVPARQIAVSPIDVGGRIVELNVVEGKLFEEGDLLARIDDTTYRAMVTEAAALLTSSERKLEASRQRLAEMRPESVRRIEFQELEAELAEAEAARVRATDDLKRYRDITGTISAREVVQAEAEYATAVARLDRLKASLQILRVGPRKEKLLGAEADLSAAAAEVEAARARKVQADWKLANCRILAPITGTALSKKAELGNLVNPLAFNAGAGSVCEIADLADLEADLEIPERDIAKLSVGQACRVRADAYSSRIYQGRLDRIMPIANRAKSIVSVRVKVALPPGETPGRYLKPEMGAVVSFLAS